MTTFNWFNDRFLPGLGRARLPFPAGPSSRSLSAGGCASAGREGTTVGSPHNATRLTRLPTRKTSRGVSSARKATMNSPPRACGFRCKAAGGHRGLRGATFAIRRTGAISRSSPLAPGAASVRSDASARPPYRLATPSESIKQTGRAPVRSAHERLAVPCAKPTLPPRASAVVLRLAGGSAVRQRCRGLLCSAHVIQPRSSVMGKYLIAWILGVPAFVAGHRVLLLH